MKRGEQGAVPLIPCDGASRSAAAVNDAQAHQWLLCVRSVQIFPSYRGLFEASQPMSGYIPPLSYIPANAEAIRGGGV